MVYLLHGAHGCYKDWPADTSLLTQASAYGMIIVCPDGQDSWYFDSPLDPKMQFETFVTQELRQEVERRYPARTDRGGRAITGLSMGGHGALWLAFRHPDLYGACGSMSGGVDFTKFPNRWSLDKRLGRYENDTALWQRHTVLSLVPTLQPGRQHIIIDDGDKDFFLEVNKTFHNALLERGIDHQFDILPGAHTWDYWVKSVKRHLRFFDRCFRGEDPLNYALGDTVQEVTVWSHKMGRGIKNTIILPRQALARGDTARYPVVYLLHGLVGNYTDWMNHDKALAQKASRYGMIIVCPDGQDSWYFDSPIDNEMQFETYLTQELRTYVDTHYPTRATRDGRAITGLSMGGHGALWLAFRHPDLYGACGSMSGAVYFDGNATGARIEQRLGRYADHPQRWRRHTVLSLVPTLENGRQRIIIDCGDKDFLYMANMTLHGALLKRGITHRFDIRPGAHTWDYWLNSIDYHLDFFDRMFHP